METDFDSSYAFSALSEPFDGANMYFRYAMNLFIMENVNCFGKKYVEDGKCIFEASTESLECQYKTFLKTCPGSHLVLHRGLKLNSKISAGRRKKFARPNWFFTRKLSKNHVKKMQRFHETGCYFVQNQNRKGSISLSNSDGQLQNILFTCYSLCIRNLRVVAVA